MTRKAVRSGSGKGGEKRLSNETSLTAYFIAPAYKTAAFWVTAGAAKADLKGSLGIVLHKKSVAWVT